MASKTMEDWFLRGGERPEAHQDELVEDPDENPGERGWDDDDKEERDFLVTLTRTKTISQTATVRVSATTANEAMDRAEDEASDVDDDDWDDVPDSEEYGDVEADDAEEAV